MRIKYCNTIRICTYCSYDNWKQINLTYSNGDAVTAVFEKGSDAARTFMKMLHEGYADFDVIFGVHLEATC